MAIIIFAIIAIKLVFIDILVATVYRRSGAFLTRYLDDYGTATLLRQTETKYFDLYTPLLEFENKVYSLEDTLQLKNIVTGAIYGHTIKDPCYFLGELEVGCLPCSFEYKDFQSCLNHSGRFEIMIGREPRVYLAKSTRMSWLFLAELHFKHG